MGLIGVGDTEGGLWESLLKAAVSSGIVGLLLLWFVYTGRQDRIRERAESLMRENNARLEALEREKRLGDRLNSVEDQIRNALATKLGAAQDAIDEFLKVAEKCSRLKKDSTSGPN